MYCLNLVRMLNESDQVAVFHVSTQPGSWRRRLARSTVQGLRIYHCIDLGEYSRMADWANRFLQESVRTTLREFRPEVVHFHNFVSLGDDLVTLARSCGAAIVYTLHDYGLICPNALLLQDNGGLCQKRDSDFFQDCCPVLIRTAGRSRHRRWRMRTPSLARWQLYARQQPTPLLRSLLRLATDRLVRLVGDPRCTGIDEKRDFFFRHTRRIFRDVDLFLAPSQFLLDRYARCGIPPSKLLFQRYGIRHFAVSRAERRAGPLRVGYIGALHAQKGLEVLLEAFRGFVGANLHVYGSAFGSPISQAFWKRVTKMSDNVFFHGKYDNDRLGSLLGDLDVVAVPSIWYENSPLTIQEAFIAGVPVVTANVGGMAELVRDNVDGLHFRVGDPADLREKLRRIVDDPRILDRLRSAIPAVPTIEEHAAEMRRHYRSLLERHET